MPEDLKSKTFKGVYWNFIDTFATYGFQFIIHIILARILLPSEYGLVGLVGIFISISYAFVDGGFGQALIQKKNASDTDYSTVFYFSLGISVLLYFILFFTAGSIGTFFNEPTLKNLIRVVALQLVISSFIIIQRTRFICDIDFKTQAIISFISNSIGGACGLVLAFQDFGVWSLVWMKLAEQLSFAAIIWLKSKWRPIWVFSYTSFKELFGFGSKLLVGSLIETIYKELNKFVIGKFYSPAQLGYYTRAEHFGNLPAVTLNSIVAKVSYPALVKLRDDEFQLKSAYVRIIRSTMFLSFLCMFSIAAVAHALIIVLIGDQWIPAIPYLQIICLYGALYPLHAINLNLLKVFGRSDLVLKLEVIKRVAAIPVVIAGIYWGIVWLLIGTVIHSIFSYIINSYWSGKLIHYGIGKQISDILPSFILTFSISGIVYFVGKGLNTTPVIVLFIQFLLLISLVFSISEMIKQQDYLYMKNLFLSIIRKK